MNKENSELVNAICELEEVRRFKEIEKYIDSNDELKLNMERLLELQRQMVNAKHLELVNAFAQFKQEYDIIVEKIVDLPLVDEFFELYQSIHLILVELFGIIEKEIEIDLK